MVKWRVDDADGFSRKVIGPDMLVQEWMSSRSSMVNVLGWLESGNEAGKDAFGAKFWDNDIKGDFVLMPLDEGLEI